VSRDLFKRSQLEGAVDIEADESGRPGNVPHRLAVRRYGVHLDTPSL